MQIAKALSTIMVLVSLAACGGGNTSTQTNTPLATAASPSTALTATNSATDTQLRGLIADEGLTGTPDAGRNLPSIDSNMATLGKFLFFSKHMGGDNDAACASCHHPALGGGDGLSMSVGVHAVNSDNVSDPELLGPGRYSELAGNMPIVKRNAPTVFNAGFYDSGLFWDARVESIGRQPLANGTASGIATPDSTTFNARDINLHPGTTLPSAQSRFPVTVSGEMRGTFAPDANNQDYRSLLAQRFVDAGGTWSQLFQSSFGDPTITFDRIADAIGEYERSMNFTHSPWNAYVTGDNTALTEQQKQGAILFYTPVNQGGAGCSRCHAGDNFTDGRFHLVAFPQMSDDHGREAVDGDPTHLYHFRTPSLLNIGASAPYGHAGLFGSLTEVVRHYVNPRGSTDTLFGGPRNQPFTRTTVPVCQLPQIAQTLTVTGDSCQTLMEDAYNNSIAALDFLDSGNGANPLGPTPRLDATQVNEVVSFLQALTDPCVENRACLAPWIVDSGNLANFPDNSALVGHDANGSPL